ncbi:VPS10 domain-containing receptor SorCS2-like [Salvelinus alpinus]
MFPVTLPWLHAVVRGFSFTRMLPSVKGFWFGSTDYSSTYERMNDKVGSKTVLSYLYVCPSNKRKGMYLERGDLKSECTKVQTCERTGRGQKPMATEIMVLTDPEFEKRCEGASYQKYHLSSYILSPMFHPTQEDWALAYSHDQKDGPLWTWNTPRRHTLWTWNTLRRRNFMNMEHS